ncbi:MAG: cytochrome c, partial [Pseudomonadota bacterium]
TTMAGQGTIRAGIGGWTFDDFKNVIHDGRGHDGEYLYPAMPYVHYTKMTDADLQSLWAYIQTLAPVNNEVDVNQLPFPFNVRQSLMVWRALYFTEGRFQPNSDKDDTWNRGAYIVESLTHCGACHTPRDAMGGQRADRRLMGAQLSEWYAPDISNGPNSIIHDWSVDRLKELLSGDSGSNHVALGEMRDVVMDLSKATEDDVHAIAVYLKDQPTNEEVAKRPPPPPVPAATKAEWEGIYANNCASCHQADGEGAPGLAASMVGEGGVLAAHPDNVISVMLEGIAPSGEFGLMPSFRDSLSDAEIAAVANYVRTSWGNEAAPNATARHVAYLRNMTETSAGVQDGAMCPSVPNDALSEATRSMVVDLAQKGSIDPADVAKITAQFKADRPDATNTDTVVDLGSTYCLTLMRGGATRSDAMEGYLSFANAVLEDITKPQ